MECRVDNRATRAMPPGYDDVIRNAAEQAFARGLLEKCKADGRHLNSACAVTVSIVDGDEIRDLNRRFRNMDKETDVLSFPLGDAAGCDDICELGDIIISAERVFLQAEAYGHSPERELGFLTAHGVLHLLGYDHETADEENKMRRLQSSVMAACGL